MFYYYTKKEFFLDGKKKSECFKRSIPYNLYLDCYNAMRRHVIEEALCSKQCYLKFKSEKHDMEDKIVLMRGLENDKSTYQKWTFGITSQETVPEEKIARAKQCLIDNGIEDDEAETVLQALCYILMDTEIFPEEEKNHE